MGLLYRGTVPLILVQGADHLTVLLHHSITGIKTEKQL